VLDFEEGKKVMKDTSVFACKVILAILLCALVFCSFGCTEQLGETAAEGHRRHLRNLRINQQEMMADIDKVLLFDRPSRLTDKRIP
jgi:hypothetical protein